VSTASTDAAWQDWVDRAKAVPIEKEIARRSSIKLKREGAAERVGPCPVCGGTDRFSINTKKQVFGCRHCKKGGDVIELVRHLDKVDFNKACETLTGEPPPHLNGNAGEAHINGGDKPHCIAEYIYRTAENQPYLRVARLALPDGGKSYPQSKWDKGKWVPGKPSGPKIPYRLPELLKARPDDPVFICEGEKCADAVAMRGLIATSASEGAGKWNDPALNKWFEGRTVYVLPDVDAPGAKHAEDVARNLHGIAQDIRIVDLPDLDKEGDDVVDWFERGNTTEGLIMLAEEAPQWTPTSPQLESKQPDKTGPRFRLVPLAEIKWEATRDYLVKGLIPQVGLTLIYGEPKCGKSFWALDVAMHVGDRRPYRGRKVQGGPTVYIAAEGGVGFSKRVRGWCSRHGGENAEFYLIPSRPDMVRDHAEMIAQIKNQLGEEKPVAIFVDTFNRTLVGSEAKDEDMAKYLRACSIIEDTFGCAVILIHHCGLEKGRPRGHTSLPAAVDAQIAITRDGAGNVVAELQLAKDLETGAEIVSGLEPVELGLDLDGDLADTLVIVPVEGKAVTSQAEPQLTANQKTAYAILRDAGQNGLSTGDWQARLRGEGIGTKRKATFFDIRTSLKAKQLVREFNDRWTAAT
jgi:hypothetical protein